MTKGIKYIFANTRNNGTVDKTDEEVKNLIKYFNHERSEGVDFNFLARYQDIKPKNDNNIHFYVLKKPGHMFNAVTLENSIFVIENKSRNEKETEDILNSIKGFENKHYIQIDHEKNGRQDCVLRSTAFLEKSFKFATKNQDEFKNERNRDEILYNFITKMKEKQSFDYLKWNIKGMLERGEYKSKVNDYFIGNENSLIKAEMNLAETEIKNLSFKALSPLNHKR